MSPLVLGEVLGLFVNILTDDNKYPVEDCENLPLSIQMQLSEIQKNFSDFFLHFWNLHQMLNILKEKMILIANVFPKLHTVKNVARGLSKKHRFRERFDSEHVKESQILAKYSWERFNDVFHYSRKFWYRKFLP